MSLIGVAMNLQVSVKSYQPSVADSGNRKKSSWYFRERWVKLDYYSIFAVSLKWQDCVSTLFHNLLNVTCITIYKQCRNHNVIPERNSDWWLR